MGDDKREPDQESAADEQPGSEPESVGDAEEETNETAPEKPVDDDLDRRNPQYIPKGGAFYEHDNRTLDDEPSEELAETEKKKKMWKESKTSERWLHDHYVEQDQSPKTAEELEEIYGYDIRNEENAPRARRRRKYGRGPEKYDRNWSDERAYVGGTRKPMGRRKPEDFPPLPNGREGRERGEERSERGKPSPPGNTAWRGPNKERSGQRMGPVLPKSSSSSSPPRQISPKPNKSRSDDHIKPFRTEANRVHDLPRSRPDPRPPSKDIHDLTQAMAGASIQQGMRSKGDPRVNEPLSEHGRNQPTEPASNRQNPKRYSKLRKNFQGYFPQEDCPELDPREAKAVMDLQQQRAVAAHIPPQRQQDILVQGVNVMPRFPDQFNGNPAYMPSRTILQSIPQPGLSPQAAIAPNLSPQMAAIEMQPQPGFVPPPVFMTPDVLNYPSYPPYPPAQNREVYQASSGITYYSPEVQAGTVSARALPQRRKAAIPIVPPPENQ